MANCVLAVVCLFAVCISQSTGFLKPRHFPVGKSVEGAVPTYSFEIKYFEQLLDHFNFRGEAVTFKQRYLINKDNWKEGGPIFFYTGNEGDIVWFSNNTGFVWDIAPEFGAMVVFAEHRYYGKTMPFGKDSFKDPLHAGYLTAEQALADFATLIRYLKNSINGARESPVVAFGGSYGGMLASWLRMKYPGTIVGAIAASAPILAYPSVASDCAGPNKVITNDFRRHGSEACVDNIKRSWPTIDKYITSVAGLQMITSIFKLCKPLVNYNDGLAFKNWLNGIYFNMAMVEYPYPASFLEPLPAWPIKKFCANMNTELMDTQLLTHLSTSMGVYFNYTGQAKCLDINEEAVQSLDSRGWGLQACTEQIMPMCANGQTDMFPAYSWDYEAYAKSCKQTWGVNSRQYWAATQWNGRTLDGVSNIVFSNGDLDPWSAFGVLKTDNPAITTIMVEEGAHHLDLRGSNPLDTKYVIHVREVEKAMIKKWIQ